MLDWDDYFMGIAEAVSKRSKDPTTKVGCVLVNQDNRVISTGYNGMLPGSEKDNLEVWHSPEKYSHVIHAEENAIQHLPWYESDEKVRLYTTMFPCPSCAKLILNLDITHVYFRDTKYFSNETADLFEKFNVIYRRIDHD